MYALINCPFLTSSPRGVVQTVPSRTVEELVLFVIGLLLLVDAEPAYDQPPPAEDTGTLGLNLLTVIFLLFAVLLLLILVGWTYELVLVGTLYATTSCFSVLNPSNSLQDDCW